MTVFRVQLRVGGATQIGKTGGNSVPIKELHVGKPLLSAEIDSRTLQERGDDAIADLLSGSTSDLRLIFNGGTHSL